MSPGGQGLYPQILEPPRSGREEARIGAEPPAGCRWHQELLMLKQEPPPTPTPPPAEGGAGHKVLRKSSRLDK